MGGDLSDERKRFLEKDFTRGFIAHCQLKGKVIARGCFQSTVEIEQHHRQQDGFIHAGVMATMADHTAGYAGFTTVAESFQILTIEFKINFLRPAHGDRLTCRAMVVREGSQIIVAESEVFDEKEEKSLAAKAMVTLMAVPREKITPENHRERVSS
jgi:uncharacterized protein (TIGR00369 family)